MASVDPGNAEARGPEPSAGEAGADESAGLAGQSLAIAAGTAFSRVTGAGRIVVGAAVLGPTVIGDLFLAINILPLTLVGIFGGPAVTSVLVPPLVRRLDEDPGSADRLVSATMGLVVTVLAAVSIVVVLARSWVARLFVGGAAPEDRDRAIEIASDLLAFMVPQLVLYGMIAVLVATQHARQRFLVPSFAPTVENVVLIVALLAMRPLLDDTDVSDNIVLLLVAASGVALVAHLALQWWGAQRAGSRFGATVPWGGRLEGLGEMASATRHSMIWTAANGALQFATIIVAGYAALGGIQAMEIATLVAILPAAIVGYPIAAAVLPRLSRENPHVNDVARAVTDGSLVALWAVVPFGVAMLVFARPIAEALALGRFEDESAIDLTTMALRGLSVSAIATSLFEIARQATMAWGELRAIAHSIWISVALAVIGFVLGLWLFDGPAMLLVLGAAISVATVAAFLTLSRPIITASRIELGHVKSQISQIVVATAIAVAAGLGAQWAIEQATQNPQIVIAVAALGFLAAFAAMSRCGRAARTLLTDLEQVGT